MREQDNMKKSRTSYIAATAQIGKDCVIGKDVICLLYTSFGEDTWFFHELMLNAKAVYYLNVPIHTYYAQRMDSSINAVSYTHLDVYKRQAPDSALAEFISSILNFFIRIIVDK